MSNDLIPLDSDAIKELAKTTGTALELAGKAGNYIAWVLGTVPRDLVGVLGGDWLGQVRIRNFARLNDRTEEILRLRGISKTDPVSPSLAVPLLRAAADESREQLQELWARLIAAAMDPNRSNRIRRSFIETVAQLDPLDAMVLSQLYETPGSLSPNPRDFLASQLAVSSREIEVSVQHLNELKCVRLLNIGDTANFILTPYGSELVLASSN
ncbi:MAG TPA: Abi-alpha family protein [Stellaceae bacterium]|jgi:hypothetical protein